MPSLLEKIAANAQQRLPLPPQRRAGEELARYRAFLKIETHRLKILHRGGAGGLEICRARAVVIDLLVQHLFEAATAQSKLSPADGRFPFALVALGGYGRGELNPQSDVDLMFLHDLETASVSRGKPPSDLAAFTDGVLYPLWDLGLKVGHSVRNVDDCAREAGADMPSKTSLLDARLVAGDPHLFARFQAVFLARCVRGFEDDYIDARLRDQAARRAKNGGVACMQEPNIKNGCGGLRDYQNLMWMAYFKYRTRALADLQSHHLVTDAERRQLERAYDFLLRVRNELHYTVGRPADLLLRNLQARVASGLGYTERSWLRRIEVFMRDLYTHMRHVFLITRTLEQRLALLPDPRRRVPSLRDLIRRGRRRVQRQIMDGFQLVDGQLHPLSSRVFRDQPRRLLRAFLYAQQRGLTLNPDLAQLIRSELSLVDRAFLRDPHVHETFLEILNQRGNVAPTLRAMHETELLGKFIPEFGRLTCLVQHEFYHQYTADEHTLACLEHLDRMWEAQTPPYRQYAELFQSVERPFVLYLALLLHDAGKAQAKDHCRVGGQMALTVAHRLGLDSGTAQTLRLLVENHLLLAVVSQRHDLDDPVAIRNLANRVQTIENLKLLTLHTVADSLGTSDQLWNTFKDLLLNRLYRKACDFMTGADAFRAVAEKQRELLAQQVRDLRAPGISDDEQAAHFNHLPARYFEAHSARDIAADLRLVHDFLRSQWTHDRHALAPVILWHSEPDRGYAQVKICTWDRKALFSKITGSLTAARLNILGAQIFTRGDGIVIDTFLVTRAQSGLLPQDDERERFEQILTTTLVDQIDPGERIEPHRPLPPLYRLPEGERIPTDVRFDNDLSEDRTVIHLETEDHLGLLYTITRVLSELDLDISVAKICTERGAAVDSFYVSERHGGKIQDPKRQQAIEQALRHGIDRLHQPT